MIYVKCILVSFVLTVAFIFMLESSLASSSTVKEIFTNDGWNYILSNDDERTARCRVIFQDGFYIDFTLKPFMKSQTFPLNSRSICQHY